jgi:hypothetical protein
LCSEEELRTQITTDKNFLQRNTKDHGIPQGLPISDVISNLYMLEFDTAVAAVAERYGGMYRRYADDMIICIPDSLFSVEFFFQRVQDLLERYTPGLCAKYQKISAYCFYRDTNGVQKYDCIQGNPNGLEYLGFRYDGESIFLRDSTIANLNRKIVKRARYEATKHVKRFPGKTLSWLIQNFPYERVQKFFDRVEDFDELNDQLNHRRHKAWTFRTYARRSDYTFRDFDYSISYQVRNIPQKVRRESRRLVIESFCARNGFNRINR